MKELLHITIAVSVLSQISVLNPVARIAMLSLWGLLIVMCIFRKRKDKKRFTYHLSPFFALYAAGYLVLAALCCVCGALGTEHFKSNYLTVMLIPFMILFVTDCMDDWLPYDALINVIKTYCLASLVYGLWVNITIFADLAASFAASSYLFTSKNSGAQIWTVAFFFIWKMILPHASVRDNKKKKALWICVMGYMVVLVVLCQCRTAMLGIAFAVVFNWFVYSKHRVRWLTVIVLAVGLALIIEPVRTFIGQLLHISRYIDASLNVISSGRINLYIQTLDNFLQSPYIGNGTYYVDCSYLSILAESGIIGFVAIESIWVTLIVRNLFFYHGARNERMLLIMMTCFYFFESLLEGYPPFGPGTCSMMFWLISEYLMQKQKRDRRVSPLPGV